MQAQTCIVTGGNSGIGRATTLGLARLGARVVVVSRSAERGQVAVDEIHKETGNSTVELAQGDIGTVAGTRALAAKLAATCPTIDVLVNNAGAWMTDFQLNADGLETTFATNHLGPFLLTNLLLDNIRAAAPARIVNVSSELHYKGVVNFDQLNTQADFGPYKSYCDSKLMNVLFTRELAGRLQGSGVTVNALHPGVIRTNLGSRARGVMGFAMRMMQPFLKGPDDGARTSLYLATSPDVADRTGLYFDDCKEKTAARAAQDDETARRLWDLSAKLAGLEQ